MSTFGAPPMSSPPLKGPPPPMLVKPLFPPGTVIQVTLFGPPRVLSPSEVTVLVAQIGQLQSKGMHPLLVAQLVMSQGFVFF